MLYLHIGLHKTGTTYLQKEVFKKVFSITDDFYYKHLDDLDENNEYISLEYFLEKYKEKKFKNYLFSSETIIQKNKLDFNFISNSEKLLDTLAKKNITEYKIIITIRRQEEIIMSLYKDSLAYGYHDLSFIEFLRKYDYFRNIYNYNLLYKELSNIFGKNKIEIISFEKFIKNKNFENFENIFLKKFNHKQFKKNYINKNISNTSAWIILWYYKIFGFKKKKTIYRIDDSLTNLIKNREFINFAKKIYDHFQNFSFNLFISNYADKFLRVFNKKLFNQEDIKELTNIFNESNNQLVKLNSNSAESILKKD